jgi:hypothetical protein
VARTSHGHARCAGRCHGAAAAAPVQRGLTRNISELPRAMRVSGRRLSKIKLKPTSIRNRDRSPAPDKESALWVCTNCRNMSTVRILISSIVDNFGQLGAAFSITVKGGAVLCRWQLVRFIDFL